LAQRRVAYSEAYPAKWPVYFQGAFVPGTTIRLDANGPLAATSWYGWSLPLPKAAWEKLRRYRVAANARSGTNACITQIARTACIARMATSVASRS